LANKHNTKTNAFKLNERNK